MAETNATSGNATCPACSAENVRLKTVDGMMICDKCASKKFSNKVRKSIQEAFEKQQEKAQRDAYNRRLQITKSAQEALSRGKIQEALQLYDKYLEVLEMRFKTQRSNIHPHLFDQKTDDQELLLLTAVFWEVAKIHDRVKANYKDFKFYLSKYVEFSIGAPYMILSAETLRKYIKAKKCTNTKDFEQAHTALRSKLGKCFIASAVYGSEQAEVKLLQEFRDQWLLKKPGGTLLVTAYYATSPAIARSLCQSTSLRRLTKEALDRLAIPLAKKALQRGN